MLTESQIRARFRKSHLRKLAEQMLQEDYYPFENGERSKTPIKWYTLRPGWTVDRIVECVRYKGIEKKREDSLFVYMRGETLETCGVESKWYKTDEFRLKEIPGTKPQAYEVLEYRSSTNLKSDLEKVDNWIKGHLLDRDRWVKNNTAIDIVIPGFFIRHK